MPSDLLGAEFAAELEGFQVQRRCLHPLIQVTLEVGGGSWPWEGAAGTPHSFLPRQGGGGEGLGRAGQGVMSD